ncbi:unnamed protein product [Oreochromis niloticus]|nr:unnamed protein product [Mustela putorius furo]
MKSSRRRKRVNPQHDAEHYIKLKTDKTGLTEQFISPRKGRGVIASQFFKQGEFVLEYRGELCKADPYLEKNKFNDTVEVFLFDFKWKGTSWCIDASVEDKSLGRLVNDDHRRPNCKMKTVEVEGRPHLCLFALRDIDPGEEITYDYGKADWPWRKMDKSTYEISKQTGDLEHCTQPLHYSDDFFLESTRGTLEDAQKAAVPIVATTSLLQPASEKCFIEYLKKRSSRQKQVSTYTETSSDESDHTDYSDADYVPDSEGSSSQLDEDGPLYPTAKKSLLSVQYPYLSPRKLDNYSEILNKGNGATTFKKRISKTPRKRKLSSHSATNGNESTPKKSRTEQISDSIKVLPPSKSGSRRVYDKRNYCLFCLQPTSKIAQHLETVHKNKEEVARAFQYPKNSRDAIG